VPIRSSYRLISILNFTMRQSMSSSETNLFRFCGGCVEDAIASVFRPSVMGIFTSHAFQTGAGTYADLRQTNSPCQR
jgi:hypothetical protein